MREITGPSLSECTTLHLGGRAISAIFIEHPDDLPMLQQKLRCSGGSPLWIGKGSNILARSGNLPIVLVRHISRKNPEIIWQNDEQAVVSVDAGLGLPRLLGFCLQHSLSGLEGLCGIPGSIGGAIAMNAGSFGCETASCLENISVWTGNDIKVYNINELDISYRNISIPGIKEKQFVTKADFILTRSKKRDIFRRMNLNFIQKKSRQPIDTWSAGCVFKNPANELSAGMLLDKAGMKGKSIGGMEFSQKHANFLINTGKGTSEQALELLDIAADTVKKCFGITLEREVRVVP